MADRNTGKPSSTTLALAWLGVVFVFWFGLFVPNMEPGLRRPVDVDLYGYFLPKFWYGNERLAAGHLPLWNPYEYAGLPFLGMGQPSALYPPKVLCFALLPAVALHAYMVLHYVLAGIFCFSALSGLGLGWMGAALGTVTWVFTGVNMDSHYAMVRLPSLTWVPLMFLFFVRTVERPGPRPVAAFATASALELLVGYPEYSLDTALALLVFGCFSSGVWRREGAVRRVAWLAVGAALVPAVCALQLLPMLDVIRESARRAVGVGSVSNLGSIFSAPAFPLVFSLLTYTFHMAPITWVLMVTGVCFGGGAYRRPSLATALASVVATLLSAPLHTLPGFALLRGSYCWISLFYFPTAYLVGRGLEVMLSLRDAAAQGKQPQPRALAALAVAVIVASAPVLAPRSWLGLAVALACLATARLRPASKTLAFLGLVVAVILAIWAWNPPMFTKPEWHRYARKESPYPPEPPRPTGLRAALAASCGPEPQRLLAPWLHHDGIPLVERVEVLQGFPEPLVPARIQRLLETIGADPSPEWARLARAGAVLDMLNVGCVFAPAAARLDEEALGLTAARRLGANVVYRRPSALPRAFVVYRAVRAADGEEALRLISRPGFDPAREVVLEDDAEVGARVDGEGRARVIMLEPEQVRLAVSSSADGLLVVSQAFFPGWRAFVDGKPVRQHRADYVLTALPVGAGTHEVVLRYQPVSVALGAILSAVGLIAVLGLALAARRQGVRP